MILHECQQLSPEWWELHRGRPTASNFHRVMTPKQKKMAAARTAFIHTLIAGVLHDGPMTDLVSDFLNGPIQNGITCEPEARDYYAYKSSADVRQIGMVVTDDGRFGSSPDFLTADNGCGELKCPTPKVHIGYLLDGVLPDDYICQVHGHLVVGGFAYCDFVSYCRNYEPFILRVTPDDTTKALAECLDKFWEEYQAALRTIQRYGDKQ